MFLLKVTYIPDESVKFYYAGMEEVAVRTAIEANKSIGYYSTEEENAEMENPDNYRVEELFSKSLFNEMVDLINDGNYVAKYDGVILAVYEQ